MRKTPEGQTWNVDESRECAAPASMPPAVAGYPGAGSASSSQPVAAPGLLYADTLAHVPHCFTTRLGGHSRGIFASLNFGNPGDMPAEERDPRAAIGANIDLVCARLGCAGREIVQVHQVHGAEVVVVRPGSPAHADPTADTKADALVTNDPARLLMVRVADCAPVLMASDDGRVVGAVHAGWRGAAANVCAAAAAGMRSLGGVPTFAAIGPCIGRSAFEVGADVARVFESLGEPFAECIAPAPCPPHAEFKFLLDLRRVLREQLLACGVANDRIRDVGGCTASDASLYFSHRRERARTGRMMACIGPRE